MVSLKHSFVSGIADGADASQVQPSHWNDEHVLTASATDVLLGRVSAGSGVVEEVSFTDPGQAIVAAVSYSAMKVLLSLNNVNNTSDANKPVSTAQAAADALRLLASANLSDLASAATAFANIKQAATTSATGVGELATDTEAKTGTDTGRLLTPSNLSAVLLYGSGANGKYIRHTPTNLQLCWHTATIVHSGGASAYMSGSWTFPAAFAAEPNCYINRAAAGSVTPTAADVLHPYRHSGSASALGWRHYSNGVNFQNGDSNDFYYFAVGLY